MTPPRHSGAVSTLWVPETFSVLRMRKRERTVTLPNGKRAKVTIDDSGTVRQTETDDQLDGLVKPQNIRIKYQGDADPAVILAQLTERFGRPHGRH